MTAPERQGQAPRSLGPVMLKRWINMTVSVSKDFRVAWRASAPGVRWAGLIRVDTMGLWHGVVNGMPQLPRLQTSLLIARLDSVAMMSRRI